MCEEDIQHDMLVGWWLCNVKRSDNSMQSKTGPCKHLLLPLFTGTIQIFARIQPMQKQATLMRLFGRKWRRGEWKLSIQLSWDNLSTICLTCTEEYGTTNRMCSCGSRRYSLSTGKLYGLTSIAQKHWVVCERVILSNPLMCCSLLMNLALILYGRLIAVGLNWAAGAIMIIQLRECELVKIARELSRGPIIHQQSLPSGACTLAC